MQIGLFFLLLLLYALISGMKAALVSIDRPAREQLARTTEPVGARIVKLLSKAPDVLASLVLAGTALVIGAAVQLSVLADGIAHATGINLALVFALAYLLAALLLITFGEVIPRSLATRNPVAFARVASGPALMFYTLLRPLSAWLGHVFTSRSNDPTSMVYTNELHALADFGQAQGTLEPEEREMIYSIIELTETTVKEIMVSRLDIVALSTDATLLDALNLIRSSGHSRLPLFEDNLDNIVGVVYGKDLLPYLTGKNRKDVVDWRLIARKPMFVPSGKMLDDLLKDFQTRKTHMAIIVDEYGGTAGLVTLEDVLEEIVGDIKDEHDTGERPNYYKIDDCTYRFDARIHLDELAEIIGIEVDCDDFDFETLGGLVFHLASSVPLQGDEFDYGPLHMRVDRVESQRIVQVTVQLQRAVMPETEQARDNNN